jgi:hypothetical protein|tara:strand:- start:448 stop:651 length:204 start_codon:yes stop_codon:yes gene_type:complete
MKITRKSPFTGKVRTKELPITKFDYKLWQRGGLLIQHAFPHLSADDREFILTGISSSEWDTAFNPSD